MLIVLLIAPFGIAAADGLGRLFFTAAERVTLNAERAASTLPLPPAAPPDEASLPAPTTPAILAPSVTLNGLVHRAHGPSTVWVNGSGQDARDATVPGTSGTRFRLGKGGV